MTVGILRTEWSGTSGGPGLTQMAAVAATGSEWSATDAQAAVNAVRAFWDAQKAMLPNELTLQVQPVVDQYDELTGTLTDSVVAATQPVVVQGTSAAVYAGGTGYKINWETGLIRAGRRVVGHTYVVPCSSGTFDTDGTLNTNNAQLARDASLALISNLALSNIGLVVWSRPSETSQTPPGLSAIQTVSITDKTAILRGRRD